MFLSNKIYYNFIFILIINSAFGNNDEYVNTAAWAYAKGTLNEQQFQKWQKAFQANKDKPHDIGIMRDVLNHFAQGAGGATSQVIVGAGVAHVNKFVDPVTDWLAEFICGTTTQQQLTIRSLARPDREKLRKQLAEYVNEFKRERVALEQTIHKNPSVDLVNRLTYLNEAHYKIERAKSQLLDQDLNDTDYFTTLYENTKNENIVHRTYNNALPALYKCIDWIIVNIYPQALKKKSLPSAKKEATTNNPYKPIVTPTYSPAGNNDEKSEAEKLAEQSLI